MREIKAVIAALNSKYIHSSLAPWCLAAAAERWAPPGVSAAVVEGTVNEPRRAVLGRILAQNPQVVGLCCYIWNIGATEELAALLRRALPEAVVVLGGPEVSYNPQAVLNRCPQADYVISGEGEEPFAAFLTALSQGRAPGEIPGLCSRGRISPPHISLREPPSPYSPEYFSALGGRIAYLETSRGCPFSCAFCLSGRCGGPRFFPLERAVGELALLAGSGTQTVKLVDRTFNANPRRAERIVDFIAGEYGNKIPAGVCVHFEIAGDILTDGLMAALERCPPGAVQLEIGLQSFHSETLLAVDRKTDTQRLSQNIARLLRGGNLHLHLDLIAGLPGEDLPRFAQSFDRAYALGPHMLQLGFLKILHGSPMGEDRARFPCTFSPTPPYQVLSTPWLSACDLTLLKGVEGALDRLYNSGRFAKSLSAVLAAGLTPFQLFDRFARFAGDFSGMALIRCAQLFYDCFSPLTGPDLLRDLLVEDWLGREPKLPRFLHRGEKTGQLLAVLDKRPQTRKRAGLRRSAARLTTGEILWVDYENRNPVTGGYPVKKGRFL